MREEDVRLRTESYENGAKKLSEWLLPNGLRHGLHRQWWPNGNRRIECLFDRGELDGVLMSYFEDGAIKEVSFWEKGKQEGNLTRFYENGVKAVVCSFKQGLLDDSQVERWPNGEIKSISRWSMGNEEGGSIYLREEWTSGEGKNHNQREEKRKWRSENLTLF